MPIPVLYELDDDSEATGQVLRFCSQACADNFDMKDSLTQFEQSCWGEEAGPQFKDEQCCHCRKIIAQQTIHVESVPVSQFSVVDLGKLRLALMAEIRRLLPPQQKYFIHPVPYLDPLKYIDEEGRLSYSHHSADQLHCYNITELPVDSLVALRDGLQHAKQLERW